MLKITKRGFPSILKDNDAVYINFISDVMKHADPEADILLDKYEKEIKVNITPSNGDFKQHLITDLLEAHRLFQMKIIFSKSLSISKKISYSVFW